jgi:hypothetical protein
MMIDSILMISAYSFRSCTGACLKFVSRKSVRSED